jgi:hypothetical protein
MPRQTDSQEARILRWVQTAPLEVVRVVVGLVKGALKDREGVGGLPKPLPLPKAKSHHKQAGGAGGGGEKPWTRSHHAAGAGAGGGGKAKARKSHHKRTRPTNGAEGAEVEEFGAGDA